MRTSHCVALGVALTLLGCGPTPTRRAPGEALDDASITARVKTNIAREAGLGEAASVNVDTYRGKVSLAGFVNTPAQIEAAERAAAQSTGVKAVENHLEVKPSR